MSPDLLHSRTREFALRIIKLVDSLPRSSAGWEIGRQLLRSGTVVCANYRAARRARSHKEFAARIGIVVEEADESELWLDCVMTSGLLAARRVKSIHAEALELVKVFASMRRTARRRSTPTTPSPNHHIAKSPHGRHHAFSAS